MGKQTGGASGEKGIGARFQEETKYTPERLRGHWLDWDNMRLPTRITRQSLRPLPCPSPIRVRRGRRLAAPAPEKVEAVV